MSPIFEPATASRGLLGYRAPLLSGEAGTAQTIRLMRKLVDRAVSDPAFVRHAIDIVRHVAPYHDMQEASVVYDWVTQNIRYTKDPVTKEKLYPPQELLKIRAGDCDDIAMLMGALMIALGYPARLVTVGANPMAPEEFSHVYLEAEVQGQWVPMDAARPGATFAVEPPAYFRKRAWSLTDDSYADLSGLGACSCGGQCSDCQVGQGGLCGALGGYARVDAYAHGHYPGLGTYGMVDAYRTGHARGLGQVDWGDILSQTITEVPQIIGVASGQGTASRGSYGVVSTGPYASFATPYTPGAGVPYAGYQAQPLGSQWISENWPWLVGGFLLLAVAGKKS